MAPWKPQRGRYRRTAPPTRIDRNHATAVPLRSCLASQALERLRFYQHVWRNEHSLAVPDRVVLLTAFHQLSSWARNSRTAHGVLSSRTVAELHAPATAQVQLAVRPAL